MPWAAELYEQMRREGLLDKVQRLSLPPPVGDVQIETGMIGFESPGGGGEGGTVWNCSRLLARWLDLRPRRDAE